MKKEEKEVKRRLIQARESVRRKSRILKQGQAALQTMREESAEPFIRPLKELSTSLLDRSMDSSSYNGKMKDLSSVGVQAGDSTPPVVSEPTTFRRIDFDDVKPPLDSDETFTFYPSTESTQIGAHSFPKPRKPTKRRYTESDMDSPTILQASKTPEGKKFIDSNLEKVNKHARPYIKWMLTGDNSGIHLDKLYGPRVMSNGKMYLGDSEFNLDMHSLYIKGQQYPGTKGLYDLIFLYNPPEQSNAYDDTDLAMYKEIVNNTNLARKGFSKTGSLNGSGKKYQKLLKPLIERETIGRGLFNVLSNRSVEYVHWDDPNELVDRLRLLIGSSRAGNHSHTNEINAIIEELIEGGIISQ